LPPLFAGSLLGTKSSTPPAGPTTGAPFQILLTATEDAWWTTGVHVVARS